MLAMTSSDGTLLAVKSRTRVSVDGFTAHPCCSTLETPAPHLAARAPDRDKNMGAADGVKSTLGLVQVQDCRRALGSLQAAPSSTPASAEGPRLWAGKRDQTALVRGGTQEWNAVLLVPEPDAGSWQRQARLRVFTSVPSCPEMIYSPVLFRVLRRLRLPLPFIALSTR